ncbi:LysR family transcriptional regulator [Rhizobium sp. P40RR-XXII]|uniref:LysR family transcriptional regulator n=1 Tax=unclassified Rhizobium TaxID=2613769 RepID=UPI00145733D8|nr:MULTISPECIES: LysR family transcriptional regulator [unclassified Rhizobium]NLR84539.1 LysR family transcriptional regulator [Rhizobium sp. P28RR-XV]NLS16554.1 LysR family transcriptional regulator [Rhizobium sp. P40RR-XXII]
MDNRAGEMDVFVQVAALRSFSAAGRKLRLSPSAISKLVTRLENRLGARLLVRTTRSLQLTPEGEVYFERAQAILADIHETERMVAAGGTAVPRGRLRVSASVAFGVRCLVPIVPDFLQCFPEIELDISLTDSVIDIVGERADVAIRVGSLRDSSLKARKLLDSRRIIVASPAYIGRNGLPATPDELDRHNCLTFNFRPTAEDWPFRDPLTGSHFVKLVRGNFQANNGPTVRSLCLEGIGLARVGQFHVQPDLDAGRLVPVLDDFNPDDIEHIHAVYAGHEHLAARIRAFIDFLVNRIG